MNIEKQVKQTISKYKLLNKNTENKKFSVPQTSKKIKEVRDDKIAVALSGGKDSASVLFILKKLGYNVEGFHMNLEIGKYSKDCERAVKKLCEKLNVKLHIFDIKKEFGTSMCYIRSAVKEKKNYKLSNCAICGVIKKWILNKKTREMGFNKIVTGHNLDDEAETVIMNILRGDLTLGINSGPITGSIKDKKFIPRIKPLFFVEEKKCKKYSKKNNLPVRYEICPCRSETYRVKIINFLNRKSEKIKLNIVKNYLKLIPKLKKGLNEKQKKKLYYCEVCGEPARNPICQKCNLLKDIL